jgi:hypothetical protein
MRNTEYNLDALLGTISASCPLDSLREMIDDMGLELVAVSRA